MAASRGVTNRSRGPLKLRRAAGGFTISAAGYRPVLDMDRILHLRIAIRELAGDAPMGGHPPAVQQSGLRENGTPFPTGDSVLIYRIGDSYLGRSAREGPCRAADSS